MIVALMFLMFFYTIGLAITFNHLPSSKAEDLCGVGVVGMIMSFMCHIAVLGMLLTTVYAAPNLESPILKPNVEQR